MIFNGKLFTPDNTTPSNVKKIKKRPQTANARAKKNYS